MINIDMENPEIKRGIDFDTRIGEQVRALESAFRWWTGRKFNKKTLLYVTVITSLNILLIYPIFGKNLGPAFYSSAFFMTLAQVLKFVFINPDVFLTGIALISLLVAPINFYLFVRRIVLRHEFTAFLATLLFILPNPFFYSVPILADALIQGDGAHVTAISFLPLFLLYVQEFIRSGVPVLGFLCAIGAAFINVISPFTAFNFILFSAVLTASEGFLGNLRIKIFRFVFLLLTGFFLSFFWYHPTVLQQIVILTHVKFAVTKFLNIAPITIPFIPVIGAFCFLIFDRREKLKPIFISLSLFLLYLILYTLSNNLNVSGIFTPDRYLIELGLASSFFLALLIVFLAQLITRTLTPLMKPFLVSLLLLSAKTFGIAIMAFFAYEGFITMQDYSGKEIITEKTFIGIGAIKRTINFADISADIAVLVSVTTLFFLFYILKKFPSLRKKPVQTPVPVQPVIQPISQT